MQECLAEHRPLLSWDCQEQLFRQEVENAEDLRLSVRLFRACLADKKKVGRKRNPRPQTACWAGMLLCRFAWHTSHRALLKDTGWLLYS